MAWPNAVAELRTLLSDGDTDKLRAVKRCIGVVNGVNKTFKTFEFRRVTDFTAPTGSFGVFVSDSGMAAVVTSDFPDTGHFVLATAPIDGQFVEATYYVRFFVDTELNNFLIDASRWLFSSDVFNNIPGGLQPAALKYAASDAYQKLAIKFMDHLSDTYRMEDLPDDGKIPVVKFYGDLSKQFRDQALKMRDEYYTRQGQPLQPLFGNNLGNVKDVPPRR